MCSKRIHLVFPNYILSIIESHYSLGYERGDILGLFFFLYFLAVSLLESKTRTNCFFHLGTVHVTVCLIIFLCLLVFRISWFPSIKHNIYFILYLLDWLPIEYQYAEINTNLASERFLWLFPNFFWVELRRLPCLYGKMRWPNLLCTFLDPDLEFYYIFED